MKNYFYLMILILSISCSKDPAEVSNPTSFELIAPANNETCLEGSTINDNQKEIVFQWGGSTNATSYSLDIINLTTNVGQTLQSNGTSLSVKLTSAEPYSWKVIASGEAGAKSASSELWKFFLAGDEVVNYAPFPPELISPRPSATIDVNSLNEIVLNWTCSDVDNDIVTFKVYLDTTDGSTLVRELDYVQNNTELGVDVINDGNYFWKVVAIDSNGNSSSSGVYSFKTK
ncbi:hypothetical protein N9H73_02650 [Flavobacteriaceae bacterium]|nr:hypothetical protein [Flavobacteriaceae bacterium]